MSKTYTQTKAHALLLANDTTFSSSDADAILDEMYQRYWFEFLKDRVKLQATFITFSQNDYCKTGAVAAREILSLVSVGSATAVLGGERASIVRDDFDAVCADAERMGVAGTPIRWGAIKLQGSQFWRIAICPAAGGVVAYDAEILPEYTTPSGATALEGDDVDAFNVARLAACEVMVRNGDDPADVAAVFGLLSESVRAKFKFILERGRPNEHARKEQV